MKDNVLDLTKLLMNKALSDWALSISTVSSEDICLKMEEIKKEK